MATDLEPDRATAAGPGLQVALRIGGLALLVWGILSEVRPGLSGAHLAVWLLIVVAVPAWVVWGALEGAASASSRRRLWIALLLCWMGAVGGAISVLAPIGLVFVGVAALGASLAFEVRIAAAIAAIGPAAVAIGSAIRGFHAPVVIGAGAATLAGLVMGVSRRQSRERVEQAALVTIARERADLESARAAVLAERNHLAREIHDVLAHTLGALSVQLEALGSVYDNEPGASDEVRQALQRTKALTSEGLEEARRAVRALRDDAPPLERQLTTLSGRSGATFGVLGAPRPLSPQASLALYRVAQESITNAVKHAPGADVEVSLAFEDSQVVLAVRNGASPEPPGDLSASGGGYGLQGIAERVRLLGGDVVAGPDGGGWLVQARLPA